MYFVYDTIRVLVGGIGRMTGRGRERPGKDWYLVTETGQRKYRGKASREFKFVTPVSSQFKKVRR
jgi:hypothetical protein